MCILYKGHQRSFHASQVKGQGSRGFKCTLLADALALCEPPDVSLMLSARKAADAKSATISDVSDYPHGEKWAP
jgi:hypothetical protein